jgi:uncharacterized protein involved in cysteine biosynthesis
VLEEYLFIYLFYFFSSLTALITSFTIDSVTDQFEEEDFIYCCIVFAFPE